MSLHGIEELKPVATKQVHITHIRESNGGRWVERLEIPMQKRKPVKKCSHEHVSRGVCLYCEENVE